MSPIGLGVVATAALAGIVLFLGEGLRRRIAPLRELNIPAPVIGGLVAAVALLIAGSAADFHVTFDSALERPLMIAFFTSIGFAASVRMLRAAGSQVVVMLVLASVFAIVQNVAGIAVATAFDLPPLFGVLTGSVTLTGGPATGLAFAPAFEKAGVSDAASVALATGMAGIVLGGLLGAPVATALIRRGRLHGAHATRSSQNPSITPQIVSTEAAPARDEDSVTIGVLKTVSVILVCMWLGSLIGARLEAAGITMPAYIGAMVVACVLRNFDDVAGWLRLSHSSIQIAGNVALSLFLVMALMRLDLAGLAHLALPILVILAVQVALVSAACFWPVYALMGRDYDSAVMCGGFVGFMLGTTANAMAVMTTLVERYGEAARAFLVLPLVGAFFLDFTNALIITTFLNVLS